MMQGKRTVESRKPGWLVDEMRAPVDHEAFLRMFNKVNEVMAERRQEPNPEARKGDLHEDESGNLMAPKLTDNLFIRGMAVASLELNLMGVEARNGFIGRLLACEDLFCSADPRLDKFIARTPEWIECEDALLYACAVSPLNRDLEFDPEDVLAQAEAIMAGSHPTIKKLEYLAVQGSA